MGRLLRVLIPAGALWLAGCADSRIQVYSIPKEDPWQLPAGWQEREADGMRAARFSAPSPDGPDIDVAIIPIRGFGGSQVDILNIWRQQLKLEPLQGDAGAAALARKVPIGSVEGELYDMTSTENLVDGKAKARSLIGVGRKDGTLWFVKMSGDDAGVARQKDVFVSFLKSVNFNNIILPALPARGSGGPGGPGGDRDPHVQGETSHNHAHDHPEWEVPAGWAEQPRPEMLNAKFVVAGEQGARADVNVSVLEGDGGGLLENVNRWRRQVGLEPWDDPAVERNVSTFDAIGGKATLVDFKGTDARTGKPARLIGAIVPVAGRTWFYKLLGDEQVADREKPAFIQFVRSAKHPNG